MSEGGRKVLMACPNFNPGIPHFSTTGPVDASHGEYAMESQRSMGI